MSITRIAVAEAGLEPFDNSYAKSMVSAKCDAKSDALFQQFADSDLLVQLLELWNRLDAAGRRELSAN